ncbi:hypothetical protein VTH06DRAFT_7001 [Thermothelomyces fergusii]
MGQIASSRFWPSAVEGHAAKGAFYKTFTRPVAKCALLAVFVYQLVYFGWSRLEVEEIKEQRQGEEFTCGSTGGGGGGGGGCREWEL